MVTSHLSTPTSPPLHLSTVEPTDTPNPGTKTLPAATGTLAALALGHGTQNYTCPSSPSATPSLIGAKAKLLDISPVLPILLEVFQSPDRVLAFLSRLPCDVEDGGDWTHWVFDRLPVLGHHFFNASGTPVFKLENVLGELQASKEKAGDIAAPDGEGVDWLKLASVSEGGLQEVYRVDTAGGEAECEDVEGGEEVEVPYAALYWFYG